MTKDDDYLYLRCLLVYRQEPRELADEEPVWRGWIQRIPEAAEAVNQDAEPARIWFSSLEEVPMIIRRIKDSS